MIAAMNRQQRRMLEKQQARVRATRRPDRPARLPMLIKAQQTLAPLEAIIDQIERDGTITTDARGTPIFHCVADGEWYASAPAISGMADFFDMWATRHGSPFKAAALRQLANRLDVGMPIDGPLMAAAVAYVKKHLPPKLTENQRKVLTNLAAGQRADAHCYGQSAFGGLTGTMASLHRAGLLDRNGITDAGRAAIAAQQGEGGAA